MSAAAKSAADIAAKEAEAPAVLEVAKLMSTADFFNEKASVRKVLDFASADGVTGLYDAMASWSAIENSKSMIHAELEKPTTAIQSVGISMQTNACASLSETFAAVATRMTNDSGPGRILGNLTGVQAAFRPLTPGEARGKLVQRAVKGIAKKSQLTMHKHVRDYLEGFGPEKR